MFRNTTRIILAQFLIIIFMGNLSAQEHSSISAFFTQDSILLDPGQTFSNTLQIRNGKTAAINIEYIRPAKQYPNMLFVPGFKGNVDPGETIYLQTKMIAGAELLMSGEGYIEFVVAFTTNGTRDSLHTRYYLNKETKDYIAIINSGIDNFYNPAIKENNVSFFVENPDYAPKSLRFNFNLSPAQNLILAQQSLNIILQPRERKLVKIGLRAKGSPTFFTDYSLSVLAYELGKEKPIANTNIAIRTITSNRQILQPSNFNTNHNFVEFAYNRMNKHYDIYRLTSNVQQQLGKDLSMEFNTVSDYFSQYKYVNIYDTRLVLGSKKMLAELGNIYGSDYDFNINGRGLKLAYNIKDNANVELLGIDNNYMLYTNLAQQIDFGMTVGAKYTQKIQNRLPTQVNYLYNTNPLLNTKTHLGNFSTTLDLNATSRIKVEGGMSNETSLNQEIAQQMLSKAGFAGGLSYEMAGENFSLFSNNYYSSPYYAGLRRGLLSMDEALNYRITDQKSFLLKYSGLINRPLYITSNTIYLPQQFTMYENRFVNHTIEAGFNNYNNGFSYSVLPNYTYQYAHNSYLNVDYQAYRIKLDLSKNFQKHYFNFIVDGGMSLIDTRKEPFYAARFLLSYRFATLSLNALADINPVTAYDLINTDTKNFRNYSLNTNYNYKTPNDRWKGTVSAGISYMNSYKGYNQFVSNQTEYRIAKEWFATGNIFFTRYSSKRDYMVSSYHNTQFQIGIKKIFGTLSSPNSSKISFKIFEDQNQNGVLDKREKVLDNVLIQIGDHVAVTNSRGMATFANLPNKEYSLTVKKNGQELSLLSSKKVSVAKNKRYNLAVVKENTVSGRMVETKKKYDLEQTDVSGINIYAQNTSTNEIRTTITDWSGGFIFRLPAGSYRIYIQNNRYEIANNSQVVSVKDNAPVKEIIFDYVNKEVEIRVKKF